MLRSICNAHINKGVSASKPKEGCSEATFLREDVNTEDLCPPLSTVMFQIRSDLGGAGCRTAACLTEQVPVPGQPLQWQQTEVTGKGSLALAVTLSSSEKRCCALLQGADTPSGDPRRTGELTSPRGAAILGRSRCPLRCVHFQNDSDSGRARPQATFSAPGSGCN